MIYQELEFIFSSGSVNENPAGCSAILCAVHNSGICAIIHDLKFFMSAIFAICTTFLYLPCMCNIFLCWVLHLGWSVPIPVFYCLFFFFHLTFLKTTLENYLTCFKYINTSDFFVLDCVKIFNIFYILGENIISLVCHCHTVTQFITIRSSL